MDYTRNEAIEILAALQAAPVSFLTDTVKTFIEEISLNTGSNAGLGTYVYNGLFESDVENGIHDWEFELYANQDGEAWQATLWIGDGNKLETVYLYRAPAVDHFDHTWRIACALPQSVYDALKQKVVAVCQEKEITIPRPIETYLKVDVY